VLLPVAGQVGQGAAQAALDSGGAVVIWVDSDGYETLPAEYRPVVLTSVLKNTGDAVVEIVDASMNDEFTNEAFIGTLENGGVDIAPFHDLEDRVPAELAAELDQLREDIIAGELEVTSPSTPR
jgi:basic membrane protein A